MSSAVSQIIFTSRMTVAASRLNSIVTVIQVAAFISSLFRPKSRLLGTSICCTPALSLEKRRRSVQATYVGLGKISESLALNVHTLQRSKSSMESFSAGLQHGRYILLLRSWQVSCTYLNTFSGRARSFFSYFIHTWYPEKDCCTLTLVLFLSAFSSEISSSFSSSCSLHAFNSFVSAANSYGIKLSVKLHKM